MTQRKYAIGEIDRMRMLIRWVHPPVGPYQQRDEDARLEDILRTYMLNGTGPEELEKKWAEMLQAKIGSGE